MGSRPLRASFPIAGASAVAKRASIDPRPPRRVARPIRTHHGDHATARSDAQLDWDSMGQKNISQIARQEAVTQLTSTEQLDQRLVVVRGSAWALLLVASLLVGLGIAWGFVGRLPHVVQGEGVIAPRGTRPIEIRSAAAVGGVVELVAATDRVVEAGDPLVRLRNRDLEVAVENASSRLRMLESQDTRLKEAESGIVRERERSLSVQLEASKQTKEQTAKLVKMVEEELSELTKLVDAQLVPRSQLVSTQQNYFGLMQQLTEQATIVARAKAEFGSLVTNIEQERIGRAGAIADARDALATARTREEVSTTVFAPIDGRILEHAVDLGSTVGIGNVVASIQPIGEGSTDIEATVFVPYGTGRRIRAGMEAQISLPFAPPSRYGYVLAKVVSVSTYVIGDAASTELGSETLARNLAQDLGPMLEVVVRLDRDESTPTGLRWTSADGYAEPIAFPALCGVRVVVSKDRPIDLVLPWIKELLGLDPPAKITAASTG